MSFYVTLSCGLLCVFVTDKMQLHVPKTNAPIWDNKAYVNLNCNPRFKLCMFSLLQGNSLFVVQKTNVWNKCLWMFSCCRQWWRLAVFLLSTAQGWVTPCSLQELLHATSGEETRRLLRARNTSAFIEMASLKQDRPVLKHTCIMRTMLGPGLMRKSQTCLRKTQVRSGAQWGLLMLLYVDWMCISHLVLLDLNRCYIYYDLTSTRAFYTVSNKNGSLKEICRHNDLKHEKRWATIFWQFTYQ